MDKVKMVAFVAVMMLAVPFLGFTADASDSDEVTNGTYTVFYNDGTGWGYQVVNAFDGAQAVKATSVWQTDDAMADKSTGGTWASPNTDYGDITTFMGKTETSDSVWNVFVYVGDAWVAGNSNIGYYLCYDDYYAQWQTANIALYYGAQTTTVPSDLGSYATDHISEITSLMYYDEVLGTEVYDESFKVSFYMRISQDGVTPTITSDAITASELATGKVITGYGSTVYLALKQALGSDVEGMDEIPGEYNSTYQYWTYNGWIDTIFELGTSQTAGTETPTDWTDDKYVWWQILSGTSGTGSTLDFVLGYYSPLSSSSASLNALSLVYAEGDV